MSAPYFLALEGRKSYPEIAAFIASLNSSLEHRVLYCGVSEREILSSLKECFDGAEFAVLRQGKAIRGVMGFDRDGEAAELWGPFASVPDGDYGECCERMWSALSEARDGLASVGIFVGAANERARAFAASIGAEPVGIHYRKTSASAPPASSVAGDKGTCHYDARFEDAFRALHDRTFKNSYWDSKDILGMVDEDHPLLVNVEGSTLRGYAFAEIDREEGEATIHYLAVNEIMRGRGLGRRLLLSCMARCRERAPGIRFALTVDSLEEGACGLYERCGFSIESIGAYYRYAVPSSALVP